jgi:SAM-dependent methyltransferase
MTKEKLGDEAAGKMLELYDSAPFPDSMQGTLPNTNVLLTPWIAAVSKRGDIFRAGCRILLAGCGSGEEAIAMSKLFPDALIVGVDFSENSIQRAKNRADERGLENLSFYRADLTQQIDFQGFEPFDFILCHGVADYVSDPDELFKTFKLCLSENGVLCMTVNSPNHPAGRIRTAFRELGINPAEFTDSADQRRLLQLLDKLIANDSGLVGIGNSPKAYLDVDIFAPIAHHDNLKTWSKRAVNAGLFFAGSMDAVLGLTKVTDTELPMLFALGKVKLSFWMSELCRRPGIQMLFTNQSIEEPDFTNLSSLFKSRPRLDPCLGALPPLSGSPEEAKHLSIRFEGLPDFDVNTKAYDLEVLRRYNGKSTISEIIDEIGISGDDESLRAALYRLYQFGLLDLKGL